MAKTLALALHTAFAASLAACAMNSSATKPLSAQDWQRAVAEFAIGEQNSPMVFDKKAAAHCQGLWLLHGDAVDDGAFPEEAKAQFIDHLSLEEAAGAYEFFAIEGNTHPARREAADKAEQLLRRELEGDAKAAHEYFRGLGACSTKPETIRDDPEGPVEGPAETHS